MTHSLKPCDAGTKSVFWGLDDQQCGVEELALQVPPGCWARLALQWDGFKRCQPLLAVSWLS